MFYYTIHLQHSFAILYTILCTKLYYMLRYYYYTTIIQVRPPQPPVYFFVIDVSEPALVSGMLHSTARAIKASLDELPGGNRAQIGRYSVNVVTL